MSDAEKSTERTATEKRRWSDAHAGVKAVSVSWPQALREARALTDDQIDAARKGCVDVRCIQHGAMNQVRREPEAVA